MSTFRSTGRKKAVLVGINYTGTQAQLKGCVRDVSFVHHLLKSRLGFSDARFHVLTDEPSGIRESDRLKTSTPTRKHILQSLHWLVDNASPGDSLWFSFSGHGSQVRDYDGDEDDGYDETILPVDFKTAGQIVDDELYSIVRRLCKGARLTILLDACHSGTAFDLPYQHDVFGKGSGQTVAGGGGPSLKNGLLGMADAVLNGNAKDIFYAGAALLSSHWKGKNVAPPDPNAGEVLMFSGCTDKQTSADTSKLAGNGITTGAMTYALVYALEAVVADGQKISELSYRRLLNNMRKTLRSNGMRQTPQFSTSQPFDVSSPFLL